MKIHCPECEEEFTVYNLNSSFMCPSCGRDGIKPYCKKHPEAKLFMLHMIANQSETHTYEIMPLGNMDLGVAKKKIKKEFGTLYGCRFFMSPYMDFVAPFAEASHFVKNAYKGIITEVK